MGECMAQLAAKYTKTKFLRIVSTDCIHGYPDRNLPTLLIYKDAECKHNLVIGLWTSLCVSIWFDGILFLL